MEAGGVTDQASNLELGVPDLPGHGNCRMIWLRGISHGETLLMLVAVVQSTPRACAKSTTFAVLQWQYIN